MSCVHGPRCRSAGRRGLSLLEVVISTFLVGVLLVAAMQTVAGSAKASLSSAARGIGLGLAQELMSEIMAARYAEPDETPVFGPEPSESTGSRSALDDVDDYHNWTASPPQERDGTEMPDRDGWQRSARVEYVSPSDLAATVADDHGVKRVTVTVSHRGETIAELVAVRTDTE